MPSRRWGECGGGWGRMVGGAGKAGRKALCPASNDKNVSWETNTPHWVLARCDFADGNDTKRWPEVFGLTKAVLRRNSKSQADLVSTTNSWNPSWHQCHLLHLKRKNGGICRISPPSDLLLSGCLHLFYSATGKAMQIKCLECTKKHFHARQRQFRLTLVQTSSLSPSSTPSQTWLSLG